MAWYHRNRNDDLSFDKEMIIQRLGDYRHKLWNLQKDLTFGCMLRGKSLKYTGESVRLSSASRIRINLLVGCGRDA